MRIEQLRKEYDIVVQWVAFPLHPDTPEDGLTLEQLFAGRNLDIGQMMQRLHKTAKDLGLPLGDRENTYNSRMAQELSKWAESRGKGDHFHEAMFSSYFVDGTNIGRPDELIRIAGSIGLPEDQAKAVLHSRSFKQAVDDDWKLSHSLGITAVPTFVVNKAKLVGAQPYEAIEQFLLKKGAQKRNKTG